jgi:tetratricopeptide (TPR) repeat protein
MIPMRSKLLVIGFLLAPMAGAFAQKIDREKLGYFNYQQPPASDELEKATYFLMKVEVEDNDAYRRQLAEQSFDGGSFKMATADDTPDFTIEIREGTYSFGSPEKKSYDNDGEMFYYYMGSVRYHITLEVTNGEGEEIFRDDVKGSDKMRGEASGSLSVANDYFVKQKSQAKQDILVKQVKELEQAFHNHFSNVDKTIHLNHVLIKEKKFDYPDFNNAASDLQRVYDILKVSTAGTDESNELLENSIGFFEEFLKDATPDDDKSRKNADVTASGYYNLGIAHFFAGNYEDARVALEKASSYNDKIMYDVKHLTGVCGELAARSGLKYYN